MLLSPVQTYLQVKGNTVLADSMPARLSDYGGLPVGLSDYGGMPAGLSDYGGMPASVGGKVKGSRLPRADSGRAIGKKARDAAAALLTSGSQSKVHEKPALQPLAVVFFQDTSAGNLRTTLNRLVDTALMQGSRLCQLCWLSATLL